MAENDKPDVLPVESGHWLPRLKIAWTVFFAALTVALCVLWARSYWKCDSIDRQYLRASASFTSFRGSLGIFWYERSADSPVFEYHNWEIGPDSSVDYNDGTGHPLPSYLGFKSSWLSAPIPLNTTTLVIPYWFPTVACIVAAITVWRRQIKYRFSLRTMLIVTTLIAVVLGLIVYTFR